ncbi:hypothetical protein LR48_Vigan08g072000 [Vigna angularis]|uniref:Uncharacterized protein n=1 Tax=Phaseolus angularis TaxID=3914 RepID=A0A0L9V4G5_PHAAN|nr:hypothetical protein LR48_Vigan08g072000 [Vigna angularis]
MLLAPASLPALVSVPGCHNGDDEQEQVQMGEEEEECDGDDEHEEVEMGEEEEEVVGRDEYDYLREEEEGGNVVEGEVEASAEECMDDSEEDRMIGWNNFGETLIQFWIGGSGNTRATSSVGGSQPEPAPSRSQGGATSTRGRTSGSGAGAASSDQGGGTSKRGRRSCSRAGPASRPQGGRRTSSRLAAQHLGSQASTN